MSRARSLKPGFFRNETLAEVPFEGRLLFAGLWTLADRAGRLEDRPKRIKADLFPYDHIDVDPLLRILHDKRFILRYEVDGVRYIQILAFGKHQTPHWREPDSTIPAPGESTESPGPAQGQPRASTIPAPGEPVPSRADSGLLTPESGAPCAPAHEAAAAPPIPQADDTFDADRRAELKANFHCTDAEIDHAERVETKRLLAGSIRGKKPARYLFAIIRDQREAPMYAAPPPEPPEEPPSADTLLYRENTAEYLRRKRALDKERQAAELAAAQGIIGNT